MNTTLRRGTLLLTLTIPILACMGGGSGGSDSGPLGGEDAYSGPLSVAAEGEPIADGDTYCTPLNTCTNTVPLFSEQRTLMTLSNSGDAPLTILSVTLTGLDDAVDEEWTLIDTELVPSPLSVDGTVLAPGEIIDFYPRFYPVQSGDRSCRITIETDGGTMSFDVVGQGAYDAYFFSSGDTDLERLLGGISSDELAGGMVVDPDGNTVFTANVSEVIDSFTPDILVASMSPEGELLWAHIWNGSYRDTSTDPGQNSESGGGADSIAVDEDGYIYVVGGTSPTNYNSTFWSLILKIDPSDGEIIWERVWSPRGEVEIASDSSEFYGVDVVDGRVYATGTAYGESEVSLVVFDADSGAVLSQTTIDANPTYNDRGYTVRVDDDGNAWIGGNGSGSALLMRLTGADTSSPEVDWVEEVGLGTGGNINSMDLDGSGNAYVGLDIRGASTTFALGRVGRDGALDWARTCSDSSNDNNNVHVVRVAGGSVYAGGRIGLALMDGQMGDGFIVKADTDGNEQWSGFYFNGTGPDEISEHRVKGMAIHQGSLHLLTQVYTGTQNGERYWGYWYDGTASLQPVTIDTAALSASAETASGSTDDAADYRNDWADLPASVVFQPAADKSNGSPPDADVMLSILSL
jgi:hypothetical protein